MCAYWNYTKTFCCFIVMLISPTILNVLQMFFFTTMLCGCTNGVCGKVIWRGLLEGATIYLQERCRHSRSNTHICARRLRYTFIRPMKNRPNKSNTAVQRQEPPTLAKPAINGRAGEQPNVRRRRQTQWMQTSTKVRSKQPTAAALCKRFLDRKNDKNYAVLTKAISEQVSDLSHSRYQSWADLLWLGLESVQPQKHVIHLDWNKIATDINADGTITAEVLPGLEERGLLRVKLQSRYAKTR